MDLLFFGYSFIVLGISSQWSVNIMGVEENTDISLGCFKADHLLFPANFATKNLFTELFSVSKDSSFRTEKTA